MKSFIEKRFFTYWQLRYSILLGGLAVPLLRILFFDEAWTSHTSSYIAGLVVMLFASLLDDMQNKPMATSDGEIEALNYFNMVLKQRNKELKEMAEEQLVAKGLDKEASAKAAQKYADYVSEDTVVALQHKVDKPNGV